MNWRGIERIDGEEEGSDEAGRGWRTARGSHTPQVGMAEAAGAQAVWAITEAKKSVKEARTEEDFIVSIVWSSKY
jgi:hypothetical protein